jgi:2-polyprenyl-3-methyl-5-hydroxy-6-metoxy-1,4-benzoquinol methylase
MNIHTVYSFFMRRFRPRRAREIRRLFPILDDPAAKVLDVGGGTYPWDMLEPAAHVTILNVNEPRTVPKETTWDFVVGDGTKLGYPDQSFDLVFSNSVIEHVGGTAAQQRFAEEMQRVGKQVYCQTPNRWFPIEPHLVTIFLHWLPFRVARRLVRPLSVWGIVTKPTQDQVDEFLLHTRLLTYKEIETLFPDCEIRRERVLGLTKSYVVTKQLASEGVC